MLKKTQNVFSLFFVVAAMLSGCDRAAEKAGDKLTDEMIESAIGENANVDISRDGEQITILSDDGDVAFSSGETAKLPDNFPTDVALPTDFEVESNMSMPQGMMVSGTLSGKSGDAVSQIKQKMISNGWKETMNMASEGSSVTSYAKENRMVNYTFDASEEKTAVSVMIAKDNA